MTVRSHHSDGGQRTGGDGDSSGRREGGKLVRDLCISVEGSRAMVQ